jgi:ketosteroid isomerase-like protein
MRRWPVLFVLLLFACAEQDPIARLMSDVADAAEERDAGAVMEHVAASYPGRAEVENTLRRYFFAYKTFDVTVRDLETTVSGGEAFATFNVDMLGVPKQVGGIDQFLPRAATYRFDVTLVEEGGEWKIASARWERRGT